MKQEEYKKFSTHDFLGIVKETTYEYIEFVTYTFRVEPIVPPKEMDIRLKRYYSKLSKALGIHIYPFIFLKIKGRMVYHCIELYSEHPINTKRVKNNTKSLKEIRNGIWRSVWKEEKMTNKDSGGGFIFGDSYKTDGHIIHYLTKFSEVISPKDYSYTFHRDIVQAPFHPRKTKQIHILSEESFQKYKSSPLLQSYRK